MPKNRKITLSVMVGCGAFYTLLCLLLGYHSGVMPWTPFIMEWALTLQCKIVIAITLLPMLISLAEHLTEIEKNSKREGP